MSRSITIRKALLATCVAGLGSIASLAYAQDKNANSVTDPAMLIESMSLALRTLNYEGTFVHAQGTNLTGMHILHASDNNGEYERLTSLDGEAREVIRNNTLVTCIWPGSQSVVVSQSKPRDLIPRVDASLVTNQRYEFSYGQPDRVAGRDTHVINVVPSDQYRYGYRFWIDVDNYMLLRSMLLESPMMPVEQVIFTQIEFLDQVDLSRFDVLGSTDRRDVVSWLEPKATKAVSTLEARKSEQANRVGFTVLPDGYSKVSETYSAMPLSEGPFSHVMLSDGMASVSVYVEYMAAPDQSESSLGLSRMGAMNAFAINIGKALVTAVGEVPEATVKAVAAAVVLRE
ncbi:MAG: MucB/RseB C-terminal domain-containing protein [Granulosicoccus sp.]